MRTTREILEEAFALHSAGKFAEAEDMYQHMLGYLDVPDGNVLASYGTLAAQQNKHGLAAYFLRHAVSLLPEHPAAWVNLSIALRFLGRREAALFCAEKGAQIANDEHAWNALAGLHVNMASAEKCVEYARKAVALAPEHAEARNNLALGLLELGRYDEAWEHYEYRWLVKEKILTRRPYKAPKWDGKPVDFLAIHGEQGIGDEIMFMGCFAEARKRAKRVVVECNHRLVDWFRDSFWTACYPDHESLIAEEGEPDAYIPMGSLPGLVGMPDGKPYLQREGWGGLKRIGIAWRGGTARTNKDERSLKPEQLRPILEIPGYEFISVQYDGAEKAKTLGLSHEIDGRNVDDCAKQIAICDLIITPCQAAVHMAGAMGIPCWVMTPKKCAWRYSGASDRMPWYNSVKLFRQDDSETWEPVVARIAEALRAA